MRNPALSACTTGARHEVAAASGTTRGFQLRSPMNLVSGPAAMAVLSGVREGLGQVPT
jgi:hypothetical protein